MHMQILRKIIQFIPDLFSEIRDLKFETRTTSALPRVSSPLLSLKALDLSGIDKNVADYLAKMYLEHRFDLLGSGWVKNSYACSALGFEGNRYDMNLEIDNYDSCGKWISFVLPQPYLARSSEIWKQVTPAYHPIDWQKDFKSGYRWNSKKWYKRQEVTPVIGAEIKVPWELCRMQHLPRMAVLSQVSKEYTKQFILEFKNQVLDFYSTNPPRMGVTWTCTMDVAIRAANLLIAYDLFIQIDDGSILDKEFRITFARCINDHGVHIYNNLEFNNGKTNNHYLSNLVGLIFIAAYCPALLKSDEWLLHGVRELLNEFIKQFFNDGTNFEESTAYHCLSTELILYATAMLIGIRKRTNSLIKKKNKINTSNISDRINTFDSELYRRELSNIFPLWFFERLFRAGNYIWCLTKPTGEVPQIGDADSGHLFQFSPNGKFVKKEIVSKIYHNLKLYQHDDTQYWDESHLNFAPLLSAIDGLLKSGSDILESVKYPLEQSIIISLMGKKKCSPELIPMKTRKEHELLEIKHRSITSPLIIDSMKSHLFRQVTVISDFKKRGHESFMKNIRLYQFTDCGIYIFRSSRVHLTVSVGRLGLQKRGGHAHRDRLSFELNIDGNDIVIDPGTYVYSSSPEKRNAFRSMQAHNGILFEEKNIETSKNNSTKRIFSPNEKVFCVGIRLGENSIEACIQYQSCLHHRSIRVLEDAIRIEDMSNIPFKVNINKFGYYSNGYGRLMNMASHRVDDQWYIR
jgi:hypothetical protein